MAGISTSRSPRRYLSISPSSGWSEFNSRLVVERSLRRRSMALNMFAEASATTAIRLVNCRRSQESQAVSEKPRTMKNAVVRITAWSSADTVRRFSMDAPKIPGGHFAEEWLIFSEVRCRKIRDVLKGLDFLRGFDGSAAGTLAGCRALTRG